ncbi:MAG TPA: ATP-binding protein [Thermoplasmatales archaeon]|nr:ATP-binding protein [Thermoplasmatales archaeon]
MQDPRTSIIEKRLQNIKRVIAVSGGKGGIGKSVTSSLLALALSKEGYKVGLLDLDLSSPSDHVILGIKDVMPVEENGVVPPEVNDVQFMSVVFYAQDKPTPLRGEEISDAIKEILCITRWNNLDFLIIDMPPGIGDELFDTIELFKKAEFLLLSTSSKVVFETVRKLMILLQEMKIPVLGIAENMKRKEESFVREVCDKYKVSFLGEIRFDENFENAVGNVEKILHTKVFKDIQKIAKTLSKQIV